MIIIQLNGGLGNQLFQYALGRRLSIERRTSLRFDLSAFDSDPQREYALNHFAIAGIPISKPELRCFFWWNKSEITKAFYKALQSSKPYYHRRIVNERTPAYDQNILRVPDTVYLKGYWQSEKYFKDIEAILRRDLAFKYPPDKSNENLLHMISNTESISLHIRRGDYVSNPVANQVLGICSNEYYQNCTKIIANKITCPYFFVFSDDIQWVKSNLQIDHPVMFVEHNGINQVFEDFRLMQTCKHHIIANSSFSWWAAWLSSYSSKIVIAPKTWFKDTAYNDRDLIPTSWIRV